MSLSIFIGIIGAVAVVYLKKKNVENKNLRYKVIAVTLVLMIGTWVFDSKESTSNNGINYENLEKPKKEKWDSLFTKEAVENMKETADNMQLMFEDEDIDLSNESKDELSQAMSYVSVFTNVNYELININNYIVRNDYKLSKKETKLIGDYVSGLAEEERKAADFFEDNFPNEDVDIYGSVSAQTAESYAEGLKMMESKRKKDEGISLISVAMNNEQKEQAYEYFYDIKNARIDIMQNYSYEDFDNIRE